MLSRAMFVGGTLARTFLPNPDPFEHDDLSPARARTIPETLAVEAPFVPPPPSAEAAHGK